MRSFAFWALVVVMKIYVYFSLVRLFKRPLYRNLAIGLGVISVLSMGVGVYALFNSFGGGISSVSAFANYSIALMISFLVCELMVSPFFLLDDLVGLFQRGRHYLGKRHQKGIKFERRKFLKQGGVLLGAIPFMSFLYGITWGKYNFTVHKQPLVFDDLPDVFDGFKIAQISDVHSGSFDNKQAVQKGIELLQAQNADVIVFTGDLVNSYASEIEPYLDDFKSLTAPYGKFSVLGNHDYPMYKRMFDNDEHGQRNLDRIKEHHQTMEFNLLLNESRKLEKEGQYIRLIGVENWGRSRHFPKIGDLDLATADCEEKEFKILMSHDPTHWEDRVKSYDKHIHLTLSGHTHGFQMGIDLPMFKWSPIKYVYKHWAGLYEEAGKFLYVNRGFGFLGFAGRVGVFPEITVFELKKG
ncbi:MULTISPECIES: metallophosphoesterase [unclassified Aureispira]|uniref:metallophosphoesterase n=1 Tax=unclassified Aureispira TaxID=2649989 RepID=UPI000695E460|nr:MULTISPECIES: metallophosphoesterase [unclassified Aureispira]WMX13835.1 metallophosphoesterase [Aureispira sp. CCB-E]